MPGAFFRSSTRALLKLFVRKQTVETDQPSLRLGSFNTRAFIAEEVLSLEFFFAFAGVCVILGFYFAH
jgi:hypothetical protein